MKAITSSLKMYVAQKLRLSNKEAIALILSERVLVNSEKGSIERLLLPEDVVTFDTYVIKEAIAYFYIAFYKPRGIETTLNKEIPHNLLQSFTFHKRLFPVGRLDKESEGLLLLTNDGSILNNIAHAENHREKEYLVSVDKPLTDEALRNLSAGIEIMGQQTRPSIVNKSSEYEFTIVLTQGLNRQIRRMCYKLGYEVTFLKRTRIMHIKLAAINPGEWRYLTDEEIQRLKQE